MQIFTYYYFYGSQSPDEVASLCMTVGLDLVSNLITFIISDM